VTATFFYTSQFGFLFIYAPYLQFLLFSLILRFVPFHSIFPFSARWKNKMAARGKRQQHRVTTAITL